MIWKVVDKGVPVTCCGEKMEELVPGTTDAAREKHVPDIKREGDTVKITVGSVVHPMLEEHYISMIAAVSGDTATVRFPKPGDCLLYTSRHSSNKSDKNRQMAIKKGRPDRRPFGNAEELTSA